MSPNGAQAEDDYFNDLSRQPDLPSTDNNKSPTKPEGAMNHDQPGEPKQKRVACVICRKRKLKCDGERPSCGTCSRLNHKCAYDEVRRKSGPKRGYVKELEARLAQVETQLKKDSGSPSAAPLTQSPAMLTNTTQSATSYIAYDAGSMNVDMAMPMDGLLSTANNFAASPTANMIPDIDLAIDENFSWEMIGLGLEEPLPTQDAVDELTSIYFENIHPSCPVIHKYRFFAGMNLSPHMRPAVCLRYAMWANSASVSEKYSYHQDILYRRARKYAEYDEMRGQGQDCVSVAHSQTWSLIAMYEFKNMFFPRAWMSVARAARLALMMGLNRMDGAGLDVKQCLAPPKDWTEREERRRAFWMAYCSDRFASVGTGWPMIVDERDIRSNLPASEQAYQSSTPETTQSLSASMTPQGSSSISSFAGVVFMAHFFGKNLHHLHRPGPDDREDDLQGEFWRRHRSLDNILLHKAMSLPYHLRLPAGVGDCNAVFINMAIHTSTICLHQAAIFNAERHGLPVTVLEQSKDRCTLAATEIANILKLISHIDTSKMNPYMPFCLYVAARVFIQLLKANARDLEISRSLNFLLAAMRWLKTKNPLSESFLIQLGLDIQGSGLDHMLQNPELTTRLKDTFQCGKHAGSGGYPNMDTGVANNASISSGAPGLSERAVFFPGEGSLQSSGPNTQPQTFFVPHDPNSASAPSRDFDVPSGENHRPPKSAQSPKQDIYPGDHNNVESFTGPAGLFPGGWKVGNPGPDVAFEQPTPPSNHTPTGLTPSDSLNTSSATSYSPHQDEARNADHAVRSPNPFSFPSARDPNHQTTSSSNNDSSDVSYSMPTTQSTNSDGFTIPPGWEFGTGNTPLPSGSTPFPTGSTPLPSGMSPSADGDWSQLLGSMSWSAAGPQQGNMNWESNTGPPPRYGYKAGILFETESQSK